MDALVSSTFALHQQTGAFESIDRFRGWANHIGIDNDDGAAAFPCDASAAEQQEWLETRGAGPAMLKALAPAGGDACDFARHTFHTTRIGRDYFARARLLFHETYSAGYPRAGESVLAGLTDEFNAIKDSQLINDLQKRIVAKVDDAVVGLQLAAAVKQTITTIRRKDRIACSIALLARQMDQAVCAEETLHRQRASSWPDDPTRQLVARLARGFISGNLRDDGAELSQADAARLGGFLEVDLEDDCSPRALLELFHRYCVDAEDSKVTLVQ